MPADLYRPQIVRDLIGFSYLEIFFFFALSWAICLCCGSWSFWYYLVHNTFASLSPDAGDWKIWFQGVHTLDLGQWWESYYNRRFAAPLRDHFERKISDKLIESELQHIFRTFTTSRQNPSAHVFVYLLNRNTNYRLCILRGKLWKRFIFGWKSELSVAISSIYCDAVNSSSQQVLWTRIVDEDKMRSLSTVQDVD